MLDRLSQSPCFYLLLFVTMSLGLQGMVSGWQSITAEWLIGLCIWAPAALLSWLTVRNEHRQPTANPSRTVAK